MTPADTSIARLRATWAAPEQATLALACLVLGFASLVGACWLSRVGTPWARLGAVALGAGGVGVAWWARRRALRGRRTDAALVRRALATSDPTLGAAASRALGLRAAVAAHPALGSEALAELHLQRLLARVPWKRVALGGARRARWWSAAVALTATGLCAAVLLDPQRALEGLSVLLARSERGAIAIDWASERSWVAEPPAYLRQRSVRLDASVPAAVPIGTELVLRASPMRLDRALVLTDGREASPLVEDGDGALVGRWTVREDATLWIASRFGSVLVLEPQSLELHARADQPPTVRLRSAPRTVRLLDEPRVGVHYEAADDHGLRQVDLVLRAGAREQRRPLSQPPGGARYDHGGVDLRLDDELLRSAHLPVEVTVEAQDDDEVGGPKWARSAPLLLVPPHVGEREAMRYEATRRLRDLLTDLLAERLLRPAHQRGSAELERQRQKRVSAEADRLLGAEFGGIVLGGIARAMTRGQLERLDRALGAFERAAGPAEHRRLLAATEQAVLGLDAALAALDGADSRAAAKLLADVALEIVAVISTREPPAAGTAADARLAAAIDVLDAGATVLLRFGTLGQQLGETVQAGLRRIRRALGAGDRFHAKLAAEDLAARLRLPGPAFQSAGGTGSGDVEAGGQPAVEGGDGGEQAEQAAGFEQALEELRERHADEMSSVERALGEGMRQAGDEQDRSELERRAEAVRDAADELPRTGASPSTSQAAAAAARSQAESMAASLERGDVEEAVRRGRDAMDSLSQAAELGKNAVAGSRDAQAGQAAASAGQKLGAELAWAEGALGRLQRTGADRVSEQLAGSAAREKGLAADARALREQSDRSSVPMPQAALDRLSEAARAMDEAARLLGERKAVQGAEQQQRAQRLLELAQPEQSQAPEPAGGESADGSRMGERVEVPGEREDERARRFRERVARGLQGHVPPELREALRRYAEGLVR